MSCVKVGVWNNVLAADPKTREANIQYAISRLKTCDRVAARCCVNISGSCASQWDGPHPQNFTEQTFREIVRITRRILDEARPTRTFYALETMPWAYPCDEESLARLVEAVDRKAFGVHVDMVNTLNSPEKVYGSGALTRSFFQRFAPLIRSVHAKDVVLGSRLTLHIDEALPGEGLFDFASLLSCCAGLGDVPVMSEHLKTEAAYDQAIAFLSRKCAELGIVPEQARA